MKFVDFREKGGKIHFTKSHFCAELGARKLVDSFFFPEIIF